MNAVSLLSSRLAQAGLLLLSVSLPVMAQSSVPAPAAAAASQPKPAEAEAEPRRSLGVVTINGTRLTVLPTQIPTTIEGISREQIATTINATDAQDALKYLPSLLVRKRYIGDYDHAVLSTRASGTGNSARSAIYADGVLISNYLGNGASFTPRWGLVTPEEIERVDVLYGPFSAAFGGNSVGAVVDYQTRMPRSFEAQVKLGLAIQPYRLYGTDDTYRSGNLSASVGDRSGDWSWFANVSRADSQGQPLVFTTRLLATGAAKPTDLPVSGAIAGQNTKAQDWWIIGDSNQAHTVQDHAKLKLAYDLHGGLRATYLLGLWQNQVDRDSRSYLKDASGNPVAGRFADQGVSINGKSYTINAADMPATREKMAHHIQALTLKQQDPVLGWELAASQYRYDTDQVRAYAPTTVKALGANAGRLTDQAGTGWTTLAARGVWRLGQAQEGGSEHQVDFGVQRETYVLRNKVSALADWQGGSPVFDWSRFEGQTQLTSLFVQDAWRLAPQWKTVLGLRREQWSAQDGLTAALPVVSGQPVPGTLNSYRHPSRDQSAFSPKLALSFAPADDWVIKASLGRALRMPTVSELYQGGFNSAGQLINNDPNLKPERSWTGEMSLERETALSRWRLTAFAEDTKDGLYSQVNLATNASTVQNVDHIRTSGLEFAWTQKEFVAKSLELNTSLTYARSKIVANSGMPSSVGKYQPRVPKLRATAQLTYRHNEAWSVSYAARYSGQQFNQLDNSDVNGFAYQGTSEFFTTDLRVQYRADRHWTVSAGVDNLNGYQYWNFHNYPQRTFHGELQYRF